jgi:hypothetical protein
MQCHDTTYRLVRDDAEGYLDPFVCVALLRFLFRRPLFRSLGVSPSIIKIKWAFRNAFLFSRVTAQRRLGRLLVRTGSVRSRLSRFYRDHRGATRRLAPPPAANTRNSCRVPVQRKYRRCLVAGAGRARPCLPATPAPEVLGAEGTADSTDEPKRCLSGRALRRVQQGSLSALAAYLVTSWSCCPTTTRTMPL